MKNKLVLMMSMLLWLGMFSACSSDDDTSSTLWGTWSIIGYGNDEDFYSDGTFDGNIFPNKVSGKYKYNENNFSFTEIFGTKLGAVDPDLQFIGIHITEVNIYKIISGSELRLYYDGDNYIKFNKEK